MYLTLLITFETPLTYHWCRVKLRDDVMEENCEVSRPRFQQVDALKRATFSVNLMQKDTTEESAHLTEVIRVNFRTASFSLFHQIY